MPTKQMSKEMQEPVQETVKDRLLVEARTVIVPGEVVAEGLGFIPGRGTYRDGTFIRAERLGVVDVDKNVTKVIPLSGRYIPKLDDKIIGRIVDVFLSGWKLDINSPYSAMLTLKDASSDFIARGEDLTRYYAFDDYVVAKIVNVTSQKLVDVTLRGPGLHKLKGGRVITVNPCKVPRVIGKEGSMVMMIKEQTGCNIVVGQNGVVWLSGEPEQELKAVKAIRMVEEHAHTQGLTDTIKAFLEVK